MNIKELLDKLYVISFEVRRNLEPGYLEKVYENAFCVELGLNGIPYQAQPGLVVKYKGVDVGEYRPDLVVDGKIIIEFKAVDVLNDAHFAQLINYLTATGMDHGILINFGEKYAFRHKTRKYHH